MEGLFIPPGYKYSSAAPNVLHNVRGRLIDPSGENFLLTNRHWEVVNVGLGEIPQTAINHMLRTGPPSRAVNVLDVGAGVDGMTMQELQEHYAAAPRKPRIFGIDLAADLDPSMTRSRIIGDAVRLPVTSESIDVAYSRQSIALMANSPGPYRYWLQLAINEVVRALRPGGIFVIDFDICYDRMFTQENNLPRLTFPANTRAYCVQQGTKEWQESAIGRIADYPIAVIVKNNEGPDAVSNNMRTIQALSLQPDRVLDP